MLAVNGINVAGMSVEAITQIMEDSGDKLEVLLLCRVTPKSMTAMVSLFD